MRLKYELLEGFVIFLKGFDTVMPGVRIQRGFVLWPIAFGPLGRLVMWITRKLENIRLGDAQVFEQFPSAVGRARGFIAGTGGWKIFDGLSEGDMGLVAVQGVDQLLAKRFVVVAFHFI